MALHPVLLITRCSVSGMTDFIDYPLPFDALLEGKGS